MVSIPESELILNKDGSIYHLNLLPEQLSDSIITVGDPERVAMISKYFDVITSKISKREFVTHTGKIGNKELTVLSTGIGTDNIDIVLNELYALSAINFKDRTLLKEPKKLKIIRVGTSGSLSEEIPLDSHVITEFAIGLEGLMNFYQYKKSEIELEMEWELKNGLAERFPFINPYVTHASSELLNQFSTSMIKGITATCQGFYHPQGRILKPNESFFSILEVLKELNFNGKKISNFEMETAGILGLSNYFGFEACSISLILANRITQKFSINAEKKMDDLIKIVLENCLN